MENGHRNVYFHADILSTDLIFFSIVEKEKIYEI